jgi:hypothetical protein
MPKNPSEKQTAASRANGRKSTGPVTAQGKQNSTAKHAPNGALSRAVLLEGESRERFNALIGGLHEELQPETMIECLLVQKMAVAHWRQVRFWTLEKSAITYGTQSQAPPVSGADAPTRDAHAYGNQPLLSGIMNRFEMTYDRQFARSLERFVRFRASRRSRNGAPVLAENNEFVDLIPRT